MTEGAPGRERHSVNREGWIEVICGCMFSGKTEELIRRLNRARIAKLKVEIFKPAIDVRYHEADIVSHNENSIRSTPIQFAEDMYLLTGDCDVVGIDEIQFFDHEIIEVCKKLANSGKRIVAAGLDMDSSGQPFGPMPELMAVAEYITKLQAICTVCGGPASFSYRKSGLDGKILLGSSEAYEARCRKHFLLE